MISITLSPEVRVHAIQTGTVAVKTSHRDHSGLPALRFPKIFLGRKWTEALPIWCWLLECPGGRFLIDTGERPAFNDADHFGGDRVAKLVHRRIMQVEVTPQDSIEAQLDSIGLAPSDIDAIVLSHLHIDHTDGLPVLAGPEVFVARREWEKQWGTAPSTWPKGFNPSKVSYESADHPFGSEFPLAKDLCIVPTPGHTHGHQSVLFDHGGATYMFAGDTSFSQQALLDGKTPGINIDFKRAASTRLAILEYATIGKLVYLPSHDPDSAERLSRRIFMRP